MTASFTGWETEATYCMRLPLWEGGKGTRKALGLGRSSGHSPWRLQQQSDCPSFRKQGSCSQGRGRAGMPSTAWC